MLALRLPPDLEKRLDALAKKTGRTKSFYAREAIMRQIEDIEDYYLARQRLARGGPRVTLESLESQVEKRQVEKRQVEKRRVEKRRVEKRQVEKSKIKKLKAR